MKAFSELRQELFTIRDWIRYGASCFNQAKLHFGHGTDNAWDEALNLVLHAVHLQHDYGVKILDGRLIDSEKMAIFGLFQERLLKRMPTAYLTQKSYYGGLEFYVDQRVLIPRSPIQETLENQCLPWIEPTSVHSILDIGTGSGCLAILAAMHFPWAKITAVDIDEDALEVARKNIRLHQMEEQITVIKSDLFENLKGSRYDIILTNPPYVDAEDMSSLPKEFLHEPRFALASGEDGLDHMRTILGHATEYLSEKGILIGEVGNSALALTNAFPELNFIWLEFERGGDGVFLLSYEELKKLNK